MKDMTVSFYNTAVITVSLCKQPQQFANTTSNSTNELTHEKNNQLQSQEHFRCYISYLI